QRSSVWRRVSLALRLPRNTWAVIPDRIRRHRPAWFPRLVQHVSKASLLHHRTPNRSLPLLASPSASLLSLPSASLRPAVVNFPLSPSRPTRYSGEPSCFAA